VGSAGERKYAGEDLPEGEDDGRPSLAEWEAPERRKYAGETESWRGSACRSGKRRTTELGAGDVTDRRQISELGGLGSVGITGRRTTEAPDDGRRSTEKFQICTGREISERERSWCEMKFESPSLGFLAA
jgi:hypothetical protein